MEALISGLVVILAVALSTYGYSKMYVLPKRLLPVSMLAAIAGWVINSLMIEYYGSSFAAAFVAAFSIAMIGEICARKVKAPAIIIIVIGILPLVPGSLVYRTVEKIIAEDISAAISIGLETIGIALSMALGILVNSTFVQLYYLTKRRLKKYQERKAINESDNASGSSDSSESSEEFKGLKDADEISDPVVIDEDTDENN